MPIEIKHEDLDLLGTGRSKIHDRLTGEEIRKLGDVKVKSKGPDDGEDLGRSTFVPGSKSKDNE